MTSPTDAVQAAPERAQEPAAIIEARPLARRFQPFREPLSAAAEALVADVLNQLQNCEKYLKLRKRARRGTDQANFKALVSALVCDLAYQHLEDPDGSIMVDRNRDVLTRRKTRYDAPFVGKTFPDVLDLMSRPEMEFAVQRPGHWGGDNGVSWKTTAVAGPRLVRRLDGLSTVDFGIGVGAEFIKLRKPKTNPDELGELVDYEDDETTRRLRAEMQTINAWIGAADLSFDTDPAAAKKINTSKRTLERNFTEGRFDRGGRLFGGWWMPLSKEVRRGIRINGEETTALDYGGMGLRVLYGRAGAPLPDGDPYARGLLERYPREAIKKLFSAMTFARSRLKQWPKETREKFDQPPPLKEVRAAIEIEHRPIVGLLYTGIGHEIQFTESNLMVDLLLTLKGLGIVALPVHDCVVVQRSHAAEVKALMLKLFQQYVSVEGAVEEE
ncbi:hypothetical protein [Inquilinus limosus]|uniref:hypothetical protein n=1 Tax=Inquilinus limosus TaxID=171674 RepID=UPI00040F8FB6|nr:hypothetical protein [Inquilinus limosus]